MLGGKQMRLQQSRAAGCPRGAGACMPAAKPSRAALRVSAVAEPIAKPAEPKYQRPDITGRYGSFGGRYVPETLIPALDALEAEYAKAMKDPAFKVGSD